MYMSLEDKNRNLKKRESECACSRKRKPQRQKKMDSIEIKKHFCKTTTDRETDRQIKEENRGEGSNVYRPFQVQLRKSL